MLLKNQTFYKKLGGAYGLQWLDALPLLCGAAALGVDTPFQSTIWSLQCSEILKSNPASCSIGNPHSCMSYEIWQVDQKMTAFSLCLFQRWKQLGGLRSARQRSHHCHSPLRSFMVSWFQVQKSSVSAPCYNVSWLRPVASVVLRSESAVGPGDVNMTKWWQNDEN